MKPRRQSMTDGSGGLDVLLSAVPARNPSEAYHADREAIDAAYVCVCGLPAPGRCCPDHGRPHEDRGDFFAVRRKENV